MKTTGECLSAETIEAGGKTHTAFVFIKPHANNEKAAAAAKQGWLYNVVCIGCLFELFPLFNNPSSWIRETL